LQLLEWENPVGGYGGSDTLLGPEETDFLRIGRITAVSVPGFPVPGRRVGCRSCSASGVRRVLVVCLLMPQAGSSFCHIASVLGCLSFGGWLGVVGLVAGLWWLLFVV
jgi:hypothetical protein